MVCKIKQIRNFAIYIPRRNSPAGIYLVKVNKRNTRTRCEICSKVTIKTPEQCHWRRFGVFIINFEHVIAGCEDQWNENILYQKILHKFLTEVTIYKIQKLISKLQLSFPVAQNLFKKFVGRAGVRGTIPFSLNTDTAQKMKFSIKDFFSKRDQIRSFHKLI